ncbi:MAG: glycosyltransferase family 1 protein [Acidobacteria bacterium]|nr:MAG: glycosyltransferase family 1 protein [Acidobacteriota bacterium]REK02939.1 MAG: glycosyltransferase family 1 protein [Acidobacteriota bacterium]REK13257.1 MAG: glycosyltransferase family 1 protein [Acidobacteriota bacterium]REK41251.1 MAG: glycosyltransferase family 1 protein [Acidobacteriota bacterium]
MRVLQVSSAKDLGGGERHFCDLSKGLARKGLDVTALIRSDCSWFEKLNGSNEGITVRQTLGISTGIGEVRAIISNAKDSGADIIHAHLARDYTRASIAARFTGTKLVLTRHLMFPVSLRTRVLLGNVSGIIAVSSAVEEVLRAGFRGTRIVPIPNGIDVKRFSQADRPALSSRFRREFQVPDHVKLITTVGELTTLKGQEDFVLAASELRKTSPDLFFVIVGRDNSRDRSYKRKLRRLVKVLGLDDHTLFLDWVEDTASLLSAADVFVSASHTESYGLAILEAMASGTPVVATRTDGAKELLKSGVSGLFAEIGDPVSIASAVDSLLKDPAGARELAAKAQTEAAERFSIERMIDETAGFYDEVLSASG